MIGVCPGLYIGWKLIHKTKIKEPSDVDLREGFAEIEEHERSYIPRPSS